ncbi:MAG: putative DNA binding domain-containing protein [Candidatus Thermoplasmatota archaeon]|nr:putative DNA binding domain-containing protein [Candidatus Thermoplasmatota archaeon]
MKGLNKKKESETVEFKKSLREWKEIVETVSAFSNTKGGTIFVGVEDSGNVVGIAVGKKSLEDIAQKIKQNTDPKIYPSISVENVKGKKVIIIEVPKSKSKPVFAFDKVFRRVGRSNHRVSSEEIRMMALEGRRVYWDAEICEGTTLEDIDKKKIKWYLMKREEIRKITKPKDLTYEELLLNIGVARKIDGNIQPTNAGILLFGKNPQRFALQSVVRGVKFKGIKITDTVIDRIDCSGVLWEMVEQIEEFIRKNIRLLSFRTPESFAREDKFEYPIQALREAVINALIHRDYREPADVRVFIFDNSIKVVNPGGFPKDVTPEKPIHKPVNPTLCNLMYDVGFIEKYGSGIYMMKELCKKWENEEPRYELHPLETNIYFSSPVAEPTLVDIEDVTAKLNERQKQGLESAHRRGFITRRDYMGICKVSHTIAHKDLKKMVNMGFLTVRGKGRGVIYIVRVRGDD